MVPDAVVLVLDEPEALVLSDGRALVLLSEAAPDDDPVDGEVNEPTVPAPALAADAGQSMVRARD